uniref:Lipocalin-related protein and Bos/Can/Equ allergen n=1 Tax=uncultured Thiotrichaceae bacterium TaxID=298394 RepID=A0A6S6SZP9_9GAMM|nr:MAG: Lipocalin-related protein and Bos/Can/Equ allergen [uncultured Thiotrichaceae bacterium]
MNTETLLDTFSTGQISVLMGLLVGLIFGIFAQQSRFCLRAACVELWRGKAGKKLSIWLLTFGAALITTQLFIETGSIDTGQIRQLNTMGSMSGAIIGGLMFGTGMVLAGGCASRLLVLSATGNMRALISGLIITIVAQAALRGILSPAREGLSSLWLVDANSRGFSHWLPQYGGVILGALFLIAAIWFVIKHQVNKWWAFAAVMTGLSVTLGWALTSWHAANSFDIVSVRSVSFTGSSADTLMALINQPIIPMSFDIGLVPGVFMGSMLAAILTREFKWQQFTLKTGQARFLIGASLMGFGGMLAGGCAVGAGVTGGVVLAITAWVALFSMWLAAGITDWVVDRRREEAEEKAAPYQPTPFEPEPALKQYAKQLL